MKRALALLFAVLLCVLSLSACSPYRSSFTAVGLVTSHNAKDGHMVFTSFRGTEVFPLDVEKDGEVQVVAAWVGEGTLVVSYDKDGTKVEWFRVSEGTESRTLTGCPGGTVYLIVESEGTARHGGIEYTVWSAS